MGFYRGPNIVTDGLMLHLDAANPKSYPGTGTTWYDLISSNNGSLVNGPTFSTANYGSIVSDGVNDLIELPYTTEFEHFKNNSFTIETVVKATSNSYPMSQHPLFLAHTVYSSAQQGWSAGHGASTTYTQIRVSDGTNFLSTNISHDTIVLSKYYHRTFVIDRTSGCVTSLYMNGEYIGQQNASSVTGEIYSQTEGDTSGFRFGNVWGWRYTGSFNLFRTYNRALTADEVLQNYNATKNRFK